MADGESQIRVSEDFESGAIGDNFTFPTADSAPSISTGLVVADGVAPDTVRLWHSTVPQSTEQHLRAHVVGYVEHATANYVGLIGRLDDGVTAASYAPRKGYILRLIYAAASVRTLELLRYNQSDGSEESLTTVVATTLTSKVSSSDIAVLQDLRFTITNDSVGVTLRGFLNNDDDLNPDISYTDLGTNTSPVTGARGTRAIGFWGFEIGSDAANDVAVESWEAYDKYVIPYESPHAGRTLEQLRDALTDEIARGGNTSVTVAIRNDWINYAQQEVMTSLGRLALFTARESTWTFDSGDDGKTLEMPSNVEAVIDILASPSRRPVSWALLGPNQDNTGWHIRVGENPSSRSFIVRYHIRWGELRDDTDRCIVPRMFDECVVLAAALKAARRATDQRWEASLAQHYKAATQRMRSYLNRQKTMQHSRVRTKPIRSYAATRDLRYVSDPSELWYGHW